MSKTIISEELVVTGDISGDGAIDIRGRVVGDIDIRAIDILAGGSVEGNVTVQTAHVRGTLKGSLSAETVDLHAQAEVQAEVTARELAAEKGARLLGKVRITGGEG